MSKSKKLGKLEGRVTSTYNPQDIAFLASYLNQCIDTINSLLDRVDQLEKEVSDLRGKINGL